MERELKGIQFGLRKTLRQFNDTEIVQFYLVCIQCDTPFIGQPYDVVCPQCATDEWIEVSSA